MAGDADTKRGLFGKYRVERLDGSSGPGGKHERCRYYVLDLDHDRFAGPALAAYAEACEEEYPGLARDLRVIRARLLRGLPRASAPLPSESEPHHASCPCGCWERKACDVTAGRGGEGTR